jgi:hypothetical protein
VPARFTAGWIGSASLAILMVVLVIGYAKQWKTASGRGWWWPPFAVVATVLIFGVTFG